MWNPPGPGIEPVLPKVAGGFLTTALPCACSAMSDSLRPQGLSPVRFLCPCDFPGKNTGVHCHALLQRIFLTQESNPRLLHWQADSLPLVPPGKPLNRWTTSKISHCIFLNALRPPCLYNSFTCVCALNKWKSSWRNICGGWVVLKLVD